MKHGKKETGTDVGSISTIHAILYDRYVFGHFRSLEVRTTMRDRAFRRYNLVKMKNKAVKMGRSVKDANHLAVCSCHMCGNPRRIWNMLTKQELVCQEDENSFA